ncbi:MAG: zinc ribbon domain-containing protein [Terriglobales bacterium]
MDHSCQHCGATVEDGRPFCSQCRAPQIRVQIAVPDAVTPSEPPAVETSLAPPQPTPAASTTALDRRGAVRAALKAGVLGVFISIIITPLLGTIFAGALAVYFYRRDAGFPLPPALGSRLGGAAGIVLFAINAITFTVWIFAFHGQQQYIDYLLKILPKFGFNPADPDIQASIHNLFTPSGLAFTFFFGMIFALALASLGGALASLFMRPRRPRP